MIKILQGSGLTQTVLAELTSRPNYKYPSCKFRKGYTWENL